MSPVSSSESSKTNPLGDKRLLFILGNQRSGTTWLSTIFDASPDTLLFVEPFAPQFKLFSTWPHEYLFINPDSATLQQILHAELPNLISRKSFFYKRPDISRSQFLFETWIMELFFKMNLYLRSDRLRFAFQYHLLNLNRIRNQKTLFFQKSSSPSTWVIKDLRLSAKVSLLAEAYQSAAFILIARHPVAVIASILDWFDRGNLQELHANVQFYLDAIETQAIYTPYLDKIKRFKNGSLIEKLAIYWMITNETTLAQFETIANPSKLLIYENLASNPKATVEELFGFAQLPLTAPVQDYISFSTTGSPAKAGAVVTSRHSQTYYKQWRDKVSPELRETVLRVVENSPLFDQIEAVYRQTN